MDSQYSLWTCAAADIWSLFVCKNQKNQFSVNDSVGLGGIRFWPASWGAITVSFMFPCSKLHEVHLHAKEWVTSLWATCAPHPGPCLPRQSSSRVQYICTKQMLRTGRTVLSSPDGIFCPAGMMEVVSFLHPHALLRPWFWMIHTGSGTEASMLCHNLSERTPSTPMAPFRGLLFTHHWWRVLPACRCQFHQVGNNEFSKELRAAQLYSCQKKKKKNQCSLTAFHLPVE